MSEPATNAGMNTLVAVAIAHAAPATRLSAGSPRSCASFAKASLNHHLDVHRIPRGRLGRVMPGRDATFVLLASRASAPKVVLKADIRPGFTDTP